MVASNSREDNPYIIGRPIYEPELFFGREKLFDFIRDNLNQGSQVILLHGQRRIGKSSVLSQIPNFVRLEKFVFVDLSLEGKSQKPLSAVLHDLAKEIIDKLDLSKDKITLPKKTDLEKEPQLIADYFLPQVYQQLNGKNLVLLLDEFDVLGDYSPDAAVTHFFPYLKFVVDRHKQLFIIPVVGRRLDDMPNLLSLFRAAPNQEIGRLDRRSAERLITKPVEEFLEYDAETIEKILELSSGHPYFTQVICFALFSHVREEQRKQITRADVESIVEQAIEIGEGGLAWFRDGLPIPERVVFSAVAEVQQEKIFSAANNETSGLEVVKGEPLALLQRCGVELLKPLLTAEERLLEWDFLQNIGRAGNQLPLNILSYKVTIELVRRWLVKRYPLQREIWELEKLDEQANRIYEQATEVRQDGDFETGRTLYEQVLVANPNHFRALFEMAEEYLEDEEFSKAAELYTRAYQIDPIRNKQGLVLSLLGYGSYLMRQGKMELATQKFTKVLELEPNNRRAQRRLVEAEAGISRSLRNPFFFGAAVPPNQFVGRSSEVNAAFDQIANHRHLAIFGSPGIGKSSLLRYLAAPETWQLQGLDPKEAIIIYINCTSINPWTPTAFVKEVLSLLRDKFDDGSSLQSEINEILKILKEEVVNKFYFQRVLRQIGKRNKFLVLLLDDYDAALQTNESYTEDDMLSFLSELHSLSIHVPESKYLSTIVTSSRRLNELGPNITLNASPWYNHYLFLPLKTFTEKEIQALIAKMPEAFVLSDAELTWVRTVTGGYPDLLQAALSILFQLHADNKPFEVKQATQELVTTIETLFSILWANASGTEQILLTLIALSNLEKRTGKQLFDFSNYNIIFNQYVRELEDLVKRGLISPVAQENNHRFVLVSSLMEWWIIKQLEAKREDELDQETQIYYLALSAMHVKQPINVIRQIWRQKVAYRAIEAWAQPMLP